MKRGATSHIEVLNLKYDKSKISYEDLVRYFFTFHDPTTWNRQGNDKGTQYASTIFYHSEEQRQIAECVIDELQQVIYQKRLPPSARFMGFKVTTALLCSTQFYPAHEKHQEYLLKNPNGYCNHRIRFRWQDIPAEEQLYPPISSFQI